MLQIRARLTSLDVRKVVGFTRIVARELARVNETGTQGQTHSMHGGPSALLQSLALQRMTSAWPAFHLGSHWRHSPQP